MQPSSSEIRRNSGLAASRLTTESPRREAGNQVRHTHPRSKLASIVTALAAIVACGALCAWVIKTCVAEYLGRRPNLESLQLAAKLDPTDSDYQLLLSRLYEYNPASVNPDRAMEHVRRAVQLDSYDPQTWLDLGAALEFDGRIPEAEACLRKADSLAPNLPHIQWAVGNFFLLHGNLREAFPHLRMVLRGTSRYDQTLFATAWKASGDGDTILQELIPDRVSTEFSYLDWLLLNGHAEETRSVWKRIMASHESFQAIRAANYIDTLLFRLHHADEAYAVWNDLRSKGLIPSTYVQESRNLALNGDFEQPIMNLGFDWRIGQSDGGYVSTDGTTYHSPGHSCLIGFTGKQNVNFQGLAQVVKVAPGRSYRLQGFVKTQGITTDSGPRLEVRDLYDPNILNKFSEDVVGNSTGWTQLMVDFKAPAKTGWIVISVVRLPSQKLDNLISGNAWVDDITVVEHSGD